MYVAAPNILQAGKQVFDTSQQLWTDTNITLPRTQSEIGYRDTLAQGARIQNEKDQRELEAGNRLVDLNEVHAKMSAIDPAFADLNRNMWQEHGIGVRTQDGGHYAKAFEMGKFYDLAPKNPLWSKGSIGFMKMKAMTEYTTAKEELGKLEEKFSTAVETNKITPEMFAQRKALSKRVADAETMLQNVATASIAIDEQAWNRPPIHAINKNQAVQEVSTAERMLGKGQRTLYGTEGMDLDSRKDLEAVTKSIDDKQRPHFLSQVISRLTSDPQSVGMTATMMNEFLGNVNAIKDIDTQQSMVMGLAYSSKKFVDTYGAVVLSAAEKARRYGQQYPERDPLNVVNQAWQEALDEAYPSRRGGGGSVPTPGLFSSKTLPGAAPAKQGSTLAPTGEGMWNEEGKEDYSEAPAQPAAAEQKQPPPEAVKPTPVAAPSATPPKAVKEAKPAEGAAPAKPTALYSHDENLGVFVTPDGKFYWYLDAVDPKTGKKGVWASLTDQMKKHLEYRKRMNAAPGKAWDTIQSGAETLFSIGNLK